MSIIKTPLAIALITVTATFNPGVLKGAAAMRTIIALVASIAILAGSPAPVEAGCCSLSRLFKNATRIVTDVAKPVKEVVEEMAKPVKEVVEETTELIERVVKEVERVDDNIEDLLHAGEDEERAREEGERNVANARREADEKERAAREAAAAEVADAEAKRAAAEAARVRAEKLERNLTEVLTQLDSTDEFDRKRCYLEVLTNEERLLVFATTTCGGE